MNKTKFFAVMLTIAIFCSIFFGCAPAAEQVVVATVNGSPITKTEIDEMVAANIVAASMQGTTEEEFFNATDTVIALKENILEMLVRERIMIDKAKELGAVYLTEAEMKKLELDAATQLKQLREAIKKQVAEQAKTDTSINVDAKTDEIVNQQLVNYGVTKDTYISGVKKTTIYSLAKDFITKDFDMNDADYEEFLKTSIAEQKAAYEADPNSVLQYYDDGNLYYYPEGSVNVKHILVKVPEEATASASQLYSAGEEAKAFELLQPELTKLMPKIDEINAKIKAGEDFNKLIEEYGEDGGMTVSPASEKGYFIVPGSTAFLKEFAVSALKLINVGDVSEPAATVYGYHIIKNISIPQTITLADLTQEQKDDIKTQQREEMLKQTVDLWLSQADVKKYTEKL